MVLRGGLYMQYVVYMGDGKHLLKNIQHLLFYQEERKG
jgi:hypothetical protein